MKRLKKLMGAIFVACAAGAIFLCSSFLKRMSEISADTGKGLNGSFEHVARGLPVNWFMYTPKTVPNSDFTISFDPKGAKDGRQSLLFTVKKCSATGGWHSPGMCYETAAKPGDEFKVSLWVKNKDSKFRVKVAGVSPFRSGDAQTTTLAENIWEWRRLDFDCKIPADMNRLRLEVNVLSPGWFWIDNVSISKK